MRRFLVAGLYVNEADNECTEDNNVTAVVELLVLTS